MEVKYTRTTITIPEDFLFEIKKIALIKRRTFKEIIEESLSAYLGKDFPSKTSISIKDLFGAWGKGPSGLSFLKKARYGKEEKHRERYIEKLWKKS